MALTLGVLTWGAYNTLINTLISYRNGGLLDAVDERILFAQEGTDVDESIAERFGFKVILSPTNVGISEGYKKLVEETTSDLFLFCENDWRLVALDAPLIVSEAQRLLTERTSDVVRLRSRRQHGYPLWTLQFAGQESVKPTHLLDCVHWTDDPDKFPPITKINSSWYTASSRFANWTNNPTMFRTDFLRVHILDKISGDIERNLQSWWEEQDFKVAQGEGLFEHYRID